MNANQLVNGKQNRFKIVSYFCGCGGLDLGFLGGYTYKDFKIPRLPFEIVAAYDSDEKCVETYSRNVSTEVAVQDLSRIDPTKVPKADLLIGGFPCQDFANGGSRGGLNSQRGRLYEAMIRYMHHYKPALVVGENVPGLATIGGGEVLDTLCSEFASEGYRVQVWQLFAPDYGVPQRRKRLFIVALRDDLSCFPIKPDKTHNPDSYRTTRWALADLESVKDDSVLNQSQYFRASRAKRGNGQGDEVCQPDMPSYTIRANAKSRVQFHYSLKRRLTVRECARLQTFPDTFDFPHAATTNVMQIGNAVPPILGTKLAESIANYLSGVNTK